MSGHYQSSSVSRILESDISAKRGCRIRVSDLLFSDDLSDNSSNSTQKAVITPQAGMTAGGNRGLSCQTQQNHQRLMRCWGMTQPTLTIES